MTVALRAGEASLADWRAIWRGATVAIDPSHRPAVAASAAAVGRILARGEPVYGINTGFGKLAGMRIGRPISPRCSATSCSRTRPASASHASVATTRLMMALKLAKSRRKAPPASSRGPSTLLEGMLARGLIPVVPSQGSVGASGDLAPLAHLAAAMIGVGDARVGDRSRPPPRRSPTPASRRSSLRPRRGLRCSMARSSRPPMRSPACSRPKRCSAPPW